MSTSHQKIYTKWNRTLFCISWWSFITKKRRQMLRRGQLTEESQMSHLRLLGTVWHRQFHSQRECHAGAWFTKSVTLAEKLCVPWSILFALNSSRDHLEEKLNCYWMIQKLWRKSCLIKLCFMKELCDEQKWPLLQCNFHVQPRQIVQWVQNSGIMCAIIATQCLQNLV